jgi:hypothetical protein
MEKLLLDKIADINAQAAARQEEAEPQAAASLKQFEEKVKAAQAEMEARPEARLERMETAMHSVPLDRDRIIQQQMGARLEGLRSCGKRTTICKVASVACPEESQSGPKEMEADVITFEECSNKMDATNVEATPVAKEDVLERQELREEETNFHNIGSSEDRCEDRRFVVRRRRGAKKRIQQSVWSQYKSSAARR